MGGVCKVPKQDNRTWPALGSIIGQKRPTPFNCDSVEKRAHKTTKQKNNKNGDYGGDFGHFSAKFRDFEKKASPITVSSGSGS